MSYYVSPIGRWYRMRATWHKRKRLLFPSPLEMQFIEIMGGRVLRFNRFKSGRNGFPMAIVLNRGKLLRSVGVYREIRVGKCFVDFGNSKRRGIEIDGDTYHSDILVQQNRDEYFALYGWELLHVRGSQIKNNPKKVRHDVIMFITK